MASSRKSPKSSRLLLHVSEVLQRHVRRHDRLVVALSGGIDSVVLCDVLQRWCKRHDCELRALHINHQISPHAERWAQFCRALCRNRGIPLRVVKVIVAHGNSLEAAARDARYRVFAQQRADHVVLAHHLDDQAETVLLQLLRGAGVRGLSAMPVLREAGGVRREGKSRLTSKTSPLTPSILRPLLDVSRSEIEAYAQQRKLEWIEDESNIDTGFDRNFLRHDVLPVLARRYPSYRTTLARSSRHLAEHAQLLDELARLDLADVTAAAGLPLALLRKLGAARAKNALRYTLHASGVTLPNTRRLEECVRQVLTVGADSQMAIDLGSHQLRCFARSLYVIVKQTQLPAEYHESWQGKQRWPHPLLGGVLLFTRRRSTGISLARFKAQAVTVRLRRGGEFFQPDPKRPRRSLKNLLQEAGIPPWQRDRLPLLYCGESLVFVPGIGIDCEFLAATGEAGLNPVWEAG